MKNMASHSLGQLSGQDLLAFDPKDTDADLKAARDFESFFVGQVFEEAHKAIPKSDFMDDNLGMEFYQTMFIQEAVKGAVNSGRGLGLTELMTKKHSTQTAPGLETLSRSVHLEGTSPPYVSPLASTEITSSFGKRDDPFNKKEHHHDGIDLKAAQGSSIHAVADGKVVFSGQMSGYGHMIKIRHGDGLETLYAHNSKNMVREGVEVKKGQVIGFTGSSGRSTGPHLHFEVQKEGVAVDPRKYVNFVNKA